MLFWMRSILPLLATVVLRMAPVEGFIGGKVPLVIVDDGPGLSRDGRSWLLLRRTLSPSSFLATVSAVNPMAC
jgi:hypothetical protein